MLPATGAVPGWVIEEDSTLGAVFGQEGDDVAQELLSKAMKKLQ